MESPVPNVAEKVLASKMLAAASGNISSELASFSGWLITGFAAGFGLLLANLFTVSKFLEAGKLGKAIALFLVAIVIHVIQRWLAAITAASIAAGKEAAEAAAAVNQVLNFGLVVSEVERAAFPPARFLIRRSFAKVAAGDLAAAGRLQFKLAQLQAFAVFVQLILSVWALAIVAVNLNV